jgi:hypothetical protein
MRHEQSAKRPTPEIDKYAMPAWFEGLIQHLDRVVADLIDEHGAEPLEIAMAFTSHTAGTLRDAGLSRSEALNVMGDLSEGCLFRYVNEIAGLAPVAGSA